MPRDQRRADGPSGTPSRRVLLISYSFPPAGGPGVQRIAKFAKYLPRFGWQPEVLTTPLGRSVPRDPSLLADVHGVEIHRVPALDPYRLWTSVKSRLPTRLFKRNGTRREHLMGSHLGPWHPAAWLIPDGKLAWVPAGLAWARTRSPAARYDVVLSTLPTPTAAILGDAIARLWGTPHVIDYRDPWTGAFYMPRRLTPLRRLESAWERRILGRAAAATYVPGVREWLPDTNTHLQLIHNGYDEDDFESVQPCRPTDHFLIGHIGTLWEERGIEPLIGAVRYLRDTRPTLADRLGFLQVGRYDGCVERQLARLGQLISVSVRPPVPHREAIAHMLGSDLLYLGLSHDHMPGKTYEYLRSRTPVLAVGPDTSHLRELLTPIDAAVVFEPTDSRGIARYVERLATRDSDGGSTDRDAIARYSRVAQTARLADLLDRVVSSGPAT